MTRLHTLGLWLLLALATCALARPVIAAPAAPLGARPAFAVGRALSGFPNQGAVTRALWAPGLEAWFVPQGVALADGELLVSGYGESGFVGGRFSSARVYRIDPATGQRTGYFMLPGEVHHAGGLVYAGNDRLYIADTHVLVGVRLAESLASPNQNAVVTGMAHLTGKLRGSFIAYDGHALWIGRYDRAAPQVLSRIDPAWVDAGRTLSETDVSVTVPIAARSQGAAFDAQGRLWLSQSSSRIGRLQRANPHTGKVLAAYDFAEGVEGLVFAPDGALWTVSEAGARRYLGWSAFHPLLLRVDPAKLQ